MSVAMIIGIAAAAGIALLIFLRARGAASVTVSQIPAVVAQLQVSGRDDSFAVFRFAGAGEEAGEATTADLQFSIEKTRLGLDWVLLAKRNLADNDKVAAFMRSKNHAVAERDMNGVRYLRVEDGDLAKLGVAIACELYGLALGAPVELIVESFDWPHSKT
jgi:hypothetical protein